ncbi:hypothetical protein EDC05_002843 [Coemansia umbellata]|uniref:C2H2-type domain-containing protein n=1 Tax=Coemansia umbellata TaxID=1424467 RepID=A0ABQ8PQG6_9FUNG|nr:hypothetical protein EDC05_002843 [Coemansia umbellata]
MDSMSPTQLPKYSRNPSSDSEYHTAARELSSSSTSSSSSLRRSKSKREHSRRKREIILGSEKPTREDYRFTQENYVCSFCYSEEATFQKLLHHISVVHPWYDLSIHRNIR